MFYHKTRGAGKTAASLSNQTRFNRRAPPADARIREVFAQVVDNPVRGGFIGEQTQADEWGGAFDLLRDAQAVVRVVVSAHITYKKSG